VWPLLDVRSRGDGRWAKQARLRDLASRGTLVENADDIDQRRRDGWIDAINGAEMSRAEQLWRMRKRQVAREM
jgi:hypothetical protein